MFYLESPRLLFRPHQPGDLDAYCAMEADPDVRRFVGGLPRTREAAELKFRNTHLKGASSTMALHATIYKPDKVYIGYCGIYPHFTPSGPPVPGEGTLAFYLDRPYWGRGLATEAARAFIAFGFGDLALTRIVATVQEGNAVSRHILEKLGFRLTHTEPGVRTFHHFELTR